MFGAKCTAESAFDSSTSWKKILQKSPFNPFFFNMSYNMYIQNFKIILPSPRGGSSQPIPMLHQEAAKNKTKKTLMRDKCFQCCQRPTVKTTLCSINVPHVVVAVLCVRQFGVHANFVADVRS